MRVFIVIVITILTCKIVNAQQPKVKLRDYRTITLYTTASNTELRLSAGGKVTLKPVAQPLETDPCIIVDDSKTFQTFVGIGGALTDASAETFYKLPTSEQQRFIQSYYSPSEGIGYTLGRTSINSCDFSSDSYTYVQDNDSSLSTFNVAHDEKYRIPFIKQAVAMAGKSFSLFVSPWSPPAWMKTNHDVLHGGKLLDACKQIWANYYAKFIHTYEAKGIPIWGLSVQNEPLARQSWESCIYTAEDERDFVKYYLGPTLAKEKLQSKKLIIWDHNRDLMFQRANVVLSDAVAAKYVWGVGYHWYETWMGGPMLFQNESRVAQTFPDKHLIFTEGCKEKFNIDSINNWSLGEKYGYSMINDFNNGTVAWTDWNVLLDERGGLTMWVIFVLHPSMLIPKPESCYLLTLTTTSGTFQNSSGRVLSGLQCPATGTRYKLQPFRMWMEVL